MYTHTSYSLHFPFYIVNNNKKQGKEYMYKVNVTTFFPSYMYV